MKEISELKPQPGASVNDRTARLFRWLAAAQAVQILIGAVLGIFVAPASLFVSRTETEAFGWIAAAFAGFASIALGVVLIPLALVAASAFRDDKKWRRVVGFAASGLAIFAFPLGTILGTFLLPKIFRARKIIFRAR